MIKMICQKLACFSAFLKRAYENRHYKPLYKLIDIIEEEEIYIVVIKIINKNITFNAKPEEILANDHLVDQFSPRDVRTLTYLGYLDINAPRYKILAKKLLENEKITFLIKKKGEEKMLVKTADQILQDTEIITGMNSEDATAIGHALASENIQNERKQKNALLTENHSEKERISQGENK